MTIWLQSLPHNIVGIQHAVQTSFYIPSNAVYWLFTSSPDTAVTMPFPGTGVLQLSEQVVSLASKTIDDPNNVAIPKNNSRGVFSGQ